MVVVVEGLMATVAGKTAVTDVAVLKAIPAAAAMIGWPVAGVDRTAAGVDRTAAVAAGAGVEKMAAAEAAAGMATANLLPWAPWCVVGAPLRRLNRRSRLGGRRIWRGIWRARQWGHRQWRALYH